MRNLRLNLLANKMLLVGSFVLMALVLVTMAATPAMANPGHDGGHGKGKGGFKGNTTSYTLEVSSPSYASGEYYTIFGSGYTPGQQVQLVYHTPGCCVGSIAWADADGNISQTNRAGWPGTYLVEAMVKDGKKTVVGASVRFDVY